MKKLEYLRRSFVNAAGTLLYISAVAGLIFNGERLFGPDGKNLIIPIFFLLLFVISASVTSLLVLGKPVLMYWDGLKKEAIILLLSTLGWLIIFLLIVIAFLMI